MTATETSTIRTQATELFKQLDAAAAGIQGSVWHREITMAGVEAVSLHGDVLTLRAGDARNLEMLEGRLRIPLERAASGAARRDIRLEFTLNGSASGPHASDGIASEPQPIRTAPAAPAEPKTEIQKEQRMEEPATESPAANVLQIATSHILAGFSKHSHYLSRFYRAYIGANAFDVWDFIRSHCKEGALVWTPVHDFTGKALARGAATSYQRVVGVWRNCGEFDRALFETGEVIPCCRQYAGQMTTTKPTDQFLEGRPTCRHWVPGALEILEAEGLAILQKHGDTPRNTFYAIQVFQHPPILTPKQATRLASKLQIEHRDFLAGLFKSQGSALPSWEAVTAFSFLPLLSEVERWAGLALSLPAVGVSSAIARNHIFFESLSCANELNRTPEGEDCT